MLYRSIEPRPGRQKLRPDYQSRRHDEWERDAWRPLDSTPCSAGSTHPRKVSAGDPEAQNASLRSMEGLKELVGGSARNLCVDFRRGVNVDRHPGSGEGDFGRCS